MPSHTGDDSEDITSKYPVFSSPGSGKIRFGRRRLADWL